MHAPDRPGLTALKPVSVATVAPVRNRICIRNYTMTYVLRFGGLRPAVHALHPELRSTTFFSLNYITTDYILRYLFCFSC